MSQQMSDDVLRIGRLSLRGRYQKLTMQRSQQDEG
jgi:hypothetical protein